MPLFSKLSSAEKKLRKYYGQYVDLYTEFGELARCNFESASTRQKNSLRCSKILKKLHDDVLPAIAAAESSVDATELRRIQAKLRDDGILTNTKK